MSTLLSCLFSLLMTSSWGFEVPVLQGPVMDQAGLISPAHQVEIEELARRYQNQGVAQIQVLTLPDLQGESIDQASIAITDQWKLGTAEKDNGILLLVSLNPKKIRIEVGQGLEGNIPDVIAKRIIRDVMAPYMREGDPSLGIKMGVYEIASYIDPNVEQAPARGKRSARGKIDLFVTVIMMLAIFLSFIFPRRRQSFFGRGRGGWSGGGVGGLGGFGGGTGGGWSGGGGGFSGGGASGDW